MKEEEKRREKKNPAKVKEEEKKERGKPMETSTERRKKSGEERGKNGQKLRLWVPPSVFIYKNVIEL